MYELLLRSHLSITTTITKITNPVYWRVTPENISTAQQAVLHIYDTQPNSAVLIPH